MATTMVDNRRIFLISGLMCFLWQIDSGMVMVERGSWWSLNRQSTDERLLAIHGQLYDAIGILECIGFKLSPANI
jgi:hypothetical protein